MKNDVIELLTFIRRAERLKVELRHSWSSDSNRQESVAEHSWMLALIAMSVFDSIDIKVDQLKVMKMVIVHDLAEAVTGDIPVFEVSERQDQKYENELIAINSITEGLPHNIANEITALWQEMEDKETPEAMLAQCLDKIEVVIQHLISDINTWDSNDFAIMPYYRDDLFEFNPYMKEFKSHVNEVFWQKMEENNMLSRLNPEHIMKRNSQIA